ncbi:MAG TPA: tonB-system energizer ExbB [Bradyrhizobium sp.]|nr:tonB-system energizer ExbB [Bradyrhizobium sp.]
MLRFDVLLLAMACLVSWNVLAEEAQVGGESAPRESPTAVSIAAPLSAAGAAAGSLETGKDSSSSGQPAVQSASPSTPSRASDRVGPEGSLATASGASREPATPAQGAAGATGMAATTSETAGQLPSRELESTSSATSSGSPRAQSPSDVKPAVGPLPDELSPWSMFLHADIVVKAVIIGLALASVATWTVLLVKTIQLRLARRAARRVATTLMSSPSFFSATRQLAGQRSAVIRFLAAAEDELDRSRDLSAEGIKERVAWELERLQGTVARQIGRGMGVLATIGAVAPFIGLFGTVWGIMNSFVGISRAHTTNLAVVAPGIAEALLATAFGLVAAIPAVVIYNIFVRSIGGYRADLTDSSVAILRLLSRDLQRDNLALDFRSGSRAADAPALSIAQSAE